MQCQENKESTNEEIQFYRKMIMETSNISIEWQKTLKIIIATLSITIASIVIVFGLICRMYFIYAYDDSAIEKSNTNTNVNTNINKNEG